MNNQLSVDLYKAISAANTPREINNWHASSIAKCPRALYFERRGVLSLNKPTGAKVLRWQTGHSIEAAIRPYLLELYPDLVSNVRLTNETLDLTGEFDNYSPKNKEIIEIKSVHPYAVITRNGQTTLKKNVARDGDKAQWEPKLTPHINHEYQEHAYKLLMEHPDTTIEAIGALGVQIPVGEAMLVEKITYIYITLGGLLVTYTTEADDEIVTKVSQKLRYLREAWQKNETPPCTCIEGKPFYAEVNQYCDYKNGTDCCNIDLLDNLKEKLNV